MFLAVKEEHNTRFPKICFASTIFEPEFTVWCSRMTATQIKSSYQQMEFTQASKKYPLKTKN